MIKNEKQLRITKKRLAEIDIRLKQHSKLNAVDDHTKGALDTLRSVRRELRREVSNYERLQSGGLKIKKNIAFANVPHLLIEHKITKGLSQKEYAAILGIKEQQLQRYEAEDFASVSFKRLLAFIESAKIDIRVSLEMR